MSTVLVIDPSTSVRETLRVVLGHEHEVIVSAMLPEGQADRPPDVVVLGLPPPPRDERAVGRALGRDFPGVPLLLLHAVRDVDVRAVVPPRVPFECLAKPFDAYAVRARVRDLVAARTRVASEDASSGGAPRELEPSFLGSDAAAIVRRVLASRLDVVLVQGEPGTGVGAVARALRVAGKWPGPLVVVDGARLGRGELAATLPDPRTAATTYVAHLDRASWAVQAEAADVVDEIRAGARDLRMVCGAERDLCALAAEGTFLPELAYAVSAVPIVLTPLRDRADDLPSLVEAISRRLAPRLGLDAVEYRPAALERLRHYLWFGNVAELEAVLTRTLVLHRPRVVEPEQLVFLPEETARAWAHPVTSPLASAAVAASPAVGVGGMDLEVVLGELAHELRNPMVTIKTVAQHFDGIVADPEARQRFSGLMVDAVGRMDGIVETLLEFARFRAPTAGPTDVGALLDRALDEQRDVLAERHVAVERNGAGPGPVTADEAQVQFALRSLCRGLLPSLVAHSTLAVHGREDGALELCVRAEPSVAARLSAWVAPRPRETDENPPLAWALAAALLARNGGMLSVRRGDDQATVIRIDWRRAAEGDLAVK
ncbi:MAG: hypothetical protein IT293_06130 [Deltaproteobacteria bacterium]|nr:hypothetical protein [Deltaproteobacteria bacterium]